jgi:lipopolysaccharide/colanic/teichoic acid biosynthesis glycosyltransferase
VSGFRGETDTQEKIDSRVRLDLQYVESWSLTLDIKIIFKTVAVLFFQDEAY